MSVLGFLHVAPSSAELFEDLARARDPQVVTRHVVDPGLLSTARTHGLPAARPAIAARLRELRDCAAVLCTCSTIAGEAAALGAAAGITVVRADQPMAQQAVRAGSRIAMAYAVESTAAASRELLLEAAKDEGRDITIVDIPCLDAWPHFETGDLTAYETLIAQRVRAIGANRNTSRTTEPVDVIVLAQASMTGAADLLTDLATPVLTVPGPAIEALFTCVASSGAPPAPNHH